MSSSVIISPGYVYDIYMNGDTENSVRVWQIDKVSGPCRVGLRVRRGGMMDLSHHPGVISDDGVR